MRRPPIDRKTLRAMLRQMSRGQLLMAVERAIEAIPPDELDVVVGDMVRIPITEGGCASVSLLDEVRAFHDESLRGVYFESFDVNGKNCTEQSKGTDAFIAEFDRLIRKCVRAAGEASPGTARLALELLFTLLRHIDDDPDRIVFFADEAGSWQVPVDWGVVLPAYFRCATDGTTGPDFARAVDRAISDFCPYQRLQLLAVAQRAANADQQAALARLPAGGA